MPSSFIFRFTLLALIILQAHSDVTTEEGTLVNSVTRLPEYPDLEHSVHVTWNKGKTLLKSRRDGIGNTKGMHTVRGTLYDCLMLDLHNCPNRSIDVTWKTDNMLVAKMKGQSIKGYGKYSKRFRAFPNGSLSLCPMQPDDEGQYTAEVFSRDGTHLCHQTIQLEYSGNKTASIQEVMGILDGSMFLHLTVMEWNDLVQIMWKKDGLLVAELNYTQLESHGGYLNRSEILPNGTLRLDRIQKTDFGRYSVEVQDRDGKIIYRRMIDVKVDAALEMPASTVDPHLLLFIIIGVLGVVFIVVLGTLIWHFEKCRQRTGRFWSVPGAHSGYNEDLVESGVGGTNSPDQGTGNQASKEPEAANSTKQENEAFIKNAEETKAATAASLYTEQPMSLNISTFQGIEGSKSQCGPMHAGNDVASVTKDCVLPEYGNYVPQDDRDCVPRDFDEYPLPRFDDCGPPEFDECSPPDFGDCHPPDFDDCVLSEFDDDDGPPEFDDIALPEFDDCGPPEFDDIALPEFDD
ncbi:uncharacterized protein LOC142820268 isoform X2 [Pelodiscus sinensis]|uniref:uncharacterized protein LOC142820268 isoform X2 n=1 Tax=Pelodiscus sinensis TaxID=13735 RepID=UPI003F6B44F0